MELSFLTAQMSKTGLRGHCLASSGPKNHFSKVTQRLGRECILLFVEGSWDSNYQSRKRQKRGTESANIQGFSSLPRLLFNSHSKTSMGPLRDGPASSHCSCGLLHIGATPGVQLLGSCESANTVAGLFSFRPFTLTLSQYCRGLGALAVMAPSTFQMLPKPLKENALLREGK